MTITLNVKERSARGKANKGVRTTGEIPAIVYGPKHEAQSISIKLSEFEKVFKEAGESTIIVLSGVGEDAEVLIHEVDVDPVTSIPRHADFYAIEKGKKLELAVPLEFVGEAPVVKLGGVVTKVLHEIEIEALPRNLPQHIVVDISSLVAFDSKIQVKDLIIPEGVEIKIDGEEIVAVASEVIEEIEEPVAPIDMDAIEVEKKGKTEEEGEAAPEGEQKGE